MEPNIGEKRRQAEILDLRMPVGLMLTLIGTILSSLGAVSGERVELQVTSQGISVNLWCGLPLLVFGITMVAFGRRAQMRMESEQRRKEKQLPRPRGEMGRKQS